MFRSTHASGLTATQCATWPSLHEHNVSPEKSNKESLSFLSAVPESTSLTNCDWTSTSHNCLRKHTQPPASNKLPSHILAYYYVWCSLPCTLNPVALVTVTELPKTKQHIKTRLCPFQNCCSLKCTKLQWPQPHGSDYQQPPLPLQVGATY